MNLYLKSVVITCILLSIIGCTSGKIDNAIQTDGNGQNPVQKTMQTEIKPQTVSVYKNTFNSGIDAWMPRGGNEVIEIQKENDGNCVLFVSNRQKTWNGPIRNIGDVIQGGETYSIKVKIKYPEGPDIQTVTLSVQQPKEDGGDSYTNLKSIQLVKNTWGTIEAEYTAPSNVGEYPPSIYCEVPWKADSDTVDTDLIDFCIDEIEIIHLNATAAIPQADIKPLCDMFSFPLGAAIRTSFVDPSNKYNPLLRHFNVIVAENDMKQENMQPQKGVFNFTNSDKLVSYSEKTGKKMRGHVLVWHSQVPDWFFQGSGSGGMATKDELYSNMENHIETIVTRYKGKVNSWDVVNECIEENGTLRNSKYLQIAGSEEYIEKAFRWAHEADPDALLFLNDYNIEYAGAKQEGFYNLVKRLIAKGVPIDGVGFQAHINIDYPSVKQIKDSIERFAALGLKVQITELDISVYASSTDIQKPASEELLTEQAYRFYDLFSMFEEEYKANKLDLVMMWGISDDCSWLNGFPVKGRNNYPLFFDGKLQAKPAYWIFADKALE